MKNENISFTHALNGRMKAESFDCDEKKLSFFIDRLKKELAEGSLPFIDYSFASDLLDSIALVKSKLPKANNMLILGIGGSALGAKALQRAFAHGQDLPAYEGPCLWIADNIDSIGLETLMNKLDPKDSIITVISKSGGTIETMAQYLILKDWLKASLGAEWSKHVVVITDSEKGALRKEAQDKNLLSLSVPSSLGGRYSIFSAVGLFPAAFMGMDYKGLLKGAMEISCPLVEKPELLAEHPSFKLACWAIKLMEKDYDQLIFFSYIPLWDYLGSWFEQLWAESLGKNGRGSQPIPALGVRDQHSLQQMFMGGPRNKGCIFLTAADLPGGRSFPMNLPEQWSFLQGKLFGDILTAEAIGTRMAMVENEIPLSHIELGKADEKACGKTMSLLMLATLFTGWLMEINPLDQPAVELGKRLANAKLGASGFEEDKNRLQAFLDAENKGSKILF